MRTLSKQRKDGVQLHQPKRNPQWARLSKREILARKPVGETPPMDVLDTLINLFNNEHTAKQKDVSFKTRRERATFLRRFFVELRKRGGFPTIPDPRNLGERHVRAMVAIWQQDKLAASTIQTYLSFLRGLAIWIDKPGLIKPAPSYGLTPEQYQHHDASNIDKSWSGHQVDIDGVLFAVTQYDVHVGAMLALIRAFGLRKKEAIMFRPFLRVVPFEECGLPLKARKADRYVSIIAGSKGGRQRYIPLDKPERVAAIELAQGVVATKDGHMGQPEYNLKQAMRRFDYVMSKFGITGKALGVTAHGLRHEALIEKYEAITGGIAPVRDSKALPNELERSARTEVAVLAGHNRPKASAAYLGALRKPTTQGPVINTSPDTNESAST